MTHVKDQSSSGGTGHRSGNSSMIEDRVKPYGRWEGAIGENICYGNDSARERLLTWLIDDGFPSRGHRRRLLGTEYQVAGISCGSHPQYNAICVLTLAGGFNEFNPGTSPAKTVNYAGKDNDNNYSGEDHFCSGEDHAAKVWWRKTQARAGQDVASRVISR